MNLFAYGENKQAQTDRKGQSPIFTAGTTRQGPNDMLDK
jgi:hypothetical protein